MERIMLITFCTLFLHFSDQINESSWQFNQWRKWAAAQKKKIDFMTNLAIVKLVTSEFGFIFVID